MFNKKNEDDSGYEKIEPVATDMAGNPDVRKRKTSVIGPTLSFKGELSANEDLIIEGEIEGTIAHQGKNLTVGKEGRVKADIAAKTVEVYGQLEGNIRGEDIVKLAKSSEVNGNISCTRIIMEDGAQFRGSIDMGLKNKPSGDTAALPIDAGKKDSAKSRAEAAG